MSAILTCGISVIMATESQGPAFYPLSLNVFDDQLAFNLDTMVPNLIYLYLHAKTSRQFQTRGFP